jgi:transcriptional regulator with XRE-family HTH domain
MTLAEKLRELRKERGWTQQEVAERSGAARAYISYLEQPRNSGTHPSAGVMLGLARAFNIEPEELYKAAGYIKDFGDTRRRPETVEELLDKLRVACPQSIPVYRGESFPFHMGDRVGPIDYVYIRRGKEKRGRVEAYIVHGNWLEPRINDGDIVIVDREGAIDNGDIVACLVSNEFHVLRVRKVASELWLEDRYGKHKFEECEDAAPVIECIRRLK